MTPSRGAATLYATYGGRCRTCGCPILPSNRNSDWASGFGSKAFTKHGTNHRRKRQARPMVKSTMCNMRRCASCTCLTSTSNNPIA